MSAPEPLPDGWKELKDPKTSKVYFYNSKTKETSWKRPAAPADATAATQEVSAAPAGTATGMESEATTDVQTPSAAAAPIEESVATPAASTAAALPDDWKELKDPKTSKVYFYNSKTKETSWKRPVANAAAPTAAAASSVPATAIPAAEPATARGSKEDTENVRELSEIVSSETKGAERAMDIETVSLKEKAKESGTLTTSTPAASVAAASTESLPEGWKELKDPKTGKVYFYNSKTKETSWKRPAAIAAATAETTASAPARRPSDEPAEVVSSVAAPQPPPDAVVAKGGGRASPLATTGNAESGRLAPSSAPAPASTAATPVATEPIPDGWKELKDPKTGKVYFFNSKTKETSWKRPAGIAPGQAAAEKPTMGSAVLDGPDPEVDGLVSRKAPVSADVDVTDSKTHAPVKPTPTRAVGGVTTTEAADPATSSGPDASARADDASQAWVPFTDPKTGKTYYANRITKARLWKLPPGAVVEAPRSGGAAGGGAAAREGPVMPMITVSVPPSHGHGGADAAAVPSPQRGGLGFDALLPAGAEASKSSLDASLGAKLEATMRDDDDDDAPSPTTTQSQQQQSGSEALRQLQREADLLQQEGLSAKDIRKARKVTVMGDSAGRGSGDGNAALAGLVAGGSRIGFLPKYWLAATDLDTGGVYFLHQITRRRLAAKPTPQEVAEEETRARDILSLETTVKREMEGLGRRREAAFLGRHGGGQRSGATDGGTDGPEHDDDDGASFDNVNHSSFWIVRFEPRIRCYYQENALTGRIRWLRREDVETAAIATGIRMLQPPGGAGASASSSGGAAGRTISGTRSGSIGGAAGSVSEEHWDAMSVTSESVGRTGSIGRTGSMGRTASHSHSHSPLRAIAGRSTTSSIGGGGSLSGPMSPQQPTPQYVVSNIITMDLDAAADTLFVFGGNRSAGAGGLSPRRSHWEGGLAADGNLHNSAAASGSSAGFKTTTCEMFDGTRWRPIAPELLSPPMVDWDAVVACRIPGTGDAVIVGTEARSHSTSHSADGLGTEAFNRSMGGVPGAATAASFATSTGGAPTAFIFSPKQRLCCARPELAGLYIPGAALSGVPRGVLVTGGQDPRAAALIGADEWSVPMREASVCDVYSLRRHALPPLSIPRTHHAQVVMDASNAFRLLWVAYAIGGFDGRRKTAAVERYVLGANHWELMKPLGIPRSAAAACIADRVVYVFGGRTGYTVTNACESMHTQTGTWTPMRPMTHARSDCGAAAVQQHLFVVGGWDGHHWLSSSEAFDTKLGLWRSVVNLPSPKAAAGVCLLPMLPSAFLADTMAQRQGSASQQRGRSGSNGPADGADARRDVAAHMQRLVGTAAHYSTASPLADGTQPTTRRQRALTSTQRPAIKFSGPLDQSPQGPAAVPQSVQALLHNR